MTYKKIAISFLVFLFALSARGQLIADFTTDPLSGSGCVPLLVHFSNSSTGSPTSYNWDLGNGTTSTYKDASTTYTTAGTYTVKLVIHKGSSSSTKTGTITVYDTPIVHFSASPVRGCSNLLVNFSDGSTLGAPGSGGYSWDFGDGSGSSAQNPSHTFPAGSYNITLVVTNSHNCVNSLTRSGYIKSLPLPAPNFVASNTRYCRPVGHDSFMNTSTGTNPLTYKWRFGDGGTSTSASPTHDYTTTGSFNVTLIVTDSNGCTDSLLRPAYVQVHHPTAGFSISKSPVCQNDTDYFTSTSSASFSTWYFSDGGNNTGSPASHVFTTSGIDTITQVVYDGYCYDTLKKTITVNPQPNTKFGFTPVKPCPASQTISFYDSTPGATSWVWDFGDGSATSSSKNPTHTYNNNDFYYAALTTTNAYGCVKTDTDTVKIYSLTLVVAAGADRGCVPLVDSFNATVVTMTPWWHKPNPPYPYPYPITYTWSFSDGGTATGSTVYHNYYDTGIFYVYVKGTTANGCVVYDTQTVKTGNHPIPYFYVDKDTVCPYTEVYFYDTSKGNVDTYGWDFGDGDGSTDSVARHQYKDTGWFKVTHVVVYRGCMDSVTHYIYVAPPVPRINYTYPCPPKDREVFHFDDTNSILATSHIWRFGDGTSSTQDTVSHRYTTLGDYRVTLVVSNSNSGCTDSTSTVVHVIDPALSFSATTDTAVCLNGWVSLSATLTGANAYTYRWFDYFNGGYINAFPFFNVGISGGTIDPWLSDTMRIKGYHTIKLVITDDNRCVDSFLRTNYLLVAKPVAAFKAVPTIGCLPLTVYFTDTSQCVQGTFVTTRNWTFGDGTSSASTTATTTHIYDATGTDSVGLIVTDNIGCKDTIVKRNLVTILKPIASFHANYINPCPGDQVQFYNTSRVDSVHDTLSSSWWDFGDGTTSTVFQPMHIYHSAGSYTVTLAVRDSHGCVDTLTKAGYINIVTPHASFTMSDSVRICPPLLVNFTNTSTGGPLGYKWYFGDGASSVLNDPTHTYTSSEYYKVMLVVFNTSGCYDTAYGHVNIYGYAGGLHYFPLLGCEPLTVHFVATITSAPTIVWDFSDGATASASGSTTIDHTYITHGAYVPKLLLGDGKGCEGSSIGLDTIKVDAVIAGIWPKTPCEKDSVHFTDTSKSYFSKITKWLWTFEDSTQSSKQNPVRYYDTLGTYTVGLLVINDNGCRDSVMDTFSLHPPPFISAGPDTVICVHDTAILSPSGGVSYVWSSASYLSCDSCTNPKIAPADTAYYYVLGIDGFGCKNRDTIKVGLQTKTTAFVDQPPPICQGESEHLHAYGAQHYIWIPQDALDSPDIADPLASPMDTVHYVMIATEGSCIPDTESVTLVVHKKPIVNAGEDQTIIGGNTAQLQGRGTYVDVFLWTPSETLNCTGCTDPVAKPLYTTVYALIGTSEYGCKDTDSVKITVLCDKSQVFIPNAFTPNGDGENDKFYPRGVAISMIKVFRIFNRWGEIVYEKMNFNINDENSGWDGTFKGIKQDPGVYVYMMDAICQSGEEIVWKGDVTIIR
jgi:gliding motility-associated-like protein